jgi:hypothetical protein
MLSIYAVFVQHHTRVKSTLIKYVFRYAKVQTDFPLNKYIYDQQADDYYFIGPLLDRN